MLTHQDFPERRDGCERRDRDRRHRVHQVPSNRRMGIDRRMVQRRETAASHIRNALQVLQALASEPNTGAADDLVFVQRRLVLALREIERGHPRRSGRS